MLSGVMKVGTGVGMMTAPIVCSLLIDSIGWQQSYLLLGLAVLLIVIPLSQFLKRDPREMGCCRWRSGYTGTPGSPFEEGLTFLRR
jgi:MFS family permease